ncbi:alpha/beta hydrolase [Flavobacterium psychrotolerans]|uniref:Esterase n=1 Tax=Flavobacterium psychrotolerans TaxID=2169410 RepID=A0A2U1JJ56_9FLAO|nr:alpha/beta hydrolase-fold protein [Flavobacterium psychrotolerans]PWA05045.1 esterase [Flavobacterium psychrotolerans]
MQKIINSMVACLIFITGNAQEVKVSAGKVQRFENFKSQFVDVRNIDVWLPDGYSDKEKYAVLYMHDGQMLYDAETTWNKQAWEVDDVAGKLISENKTQKFIVVGIWNSDQKRHPEYFPQKPYESLTQIQRDTITSQLQKAGKTTAVFKPFSDAYLKFLVTELKPYIDKTFSTKKDRKNTFIAGSSMGGLISMYAICEYPKVFGGAACMSTHWPGAFSAANNPIPDAFINYLKNNLPNPKNHKIYFDYGDQTLDVLYKPLQEKVDVVMKAKGFTDKNWITKFFPGKDHSEKSWHDRLDIPLVFLLKK